MNDGQRAACQDQTAVGTACEAGDRSLNLAGVAYVDRTELDAKRWRHGLNCAPQPDAGRYGGIADDCHSRHAWRNLLEQLQPFCADSVFKGSKPSDVPTRPCQTVDERRPDWIGNLREHDWQGACHPLQWCDRCTARRENHVRRKRDQFRRVSAGVVLVAPRPTVIDRNVVPDDPTELLQSLYKCRVTGLR